MRVGRTVTITSGVRCQPYDLALAPDQAALDEKQRQPGEHVTGEAVDVAAVGSRARYQIVEAAIAAGVRRIGIGRDFIHLGVSDSHDLDVIWMYGG